MITGRVLGGNLYPLVDLEIRDGDGAVNLVKFIVDTGTDFSLVMTLDLIARLRLQELTGTTVITSATGDRRSARYYLAEVMWDGEFKLVRVIEGIAPLMGRELMRSYSLSIEMRLGGLVSIAPLESW